MKIEPIDDLVSEPRCATSAELLNLSATLCPHDYSGPAGRLTCEKCGLTVSWLHTEYKSSDLYDGFV